MTTTTTRVPCPTWCTTHHAPVETEYETHDGPNFVSPVVAGLTVQLWRADADGYVPSIAVDGVDLASLTDAEAHELGMALVRAADRLRRDRQEC